MFNRKRKRTCVVRYTRTYKKDIRFTKNRMSFLPIVNVGKYLVQHCVYNSD